MNPDIGEHMLIIFFKGIGVISGVCGPIIALLISVISFLSWPLLGISIFFYMNYRHKRKTILKEFALNNELTIKGCDLEGTYRRHFIKMKCFSLIYEGGEDAHRYDKNIVIKHNVNFDGHLTISNFNIGLLDGLIAPNIKIGDNVFDQTFAVRGQNISQRLINHILTDDIKNELYILKPYKLIVEVKKDRVCCLFKSNNIFTNKIDDLKLAMDLMVDITERVQSFQ